MSKLMTARAKQTSVLMAARDLRDSDPVLAHDFSCTCPECFPEEEPTDAERREGEYSAELSHRREHGPR